MKIKISNYSNDIHYIDFTESTVNLEIDAKSLEDIKVKCKMDKSSSQIVFECNIEAKVLFECDRCTKDFEAIVENEFTLTYLIGENKLETEDVNTRYITVETDKIDLSEEIRDYFLLSVPLKRLCDDNCKGLCFRCGHNLNEKECDCSKDQTDSVWAPLLKLKDKLN